tara:strand:- start:6198 stop:6479 length:282 start_codon:yes stop_codon:yes gene_type:complete
MSDNFFKRPSLAEWLLFLVAALWLFDMLYGGPFGMVAACLLIAGGLLGLWAVCRWTGRCVGYAAGWVAREFLVGVQEGRANAMRKGQESTDAR